jgi:hypothetical protein
MAWLYIKHNDSAFATGFFDPAGQWHTDMSFTNADDAATRVNYLNGGTGQKPKGEEASIDDKVDDLRSRPPLPPIKPTAKPK